MFHWKSAWEDLKAGKSIELSKGTLTQSCDVAKDRYEFVYRSVTTVRRFVDRSEFELAGSSRYKMLGEIVEEMIKAADDIEPSEAMPISYDELTDSEKEEIRGRSASFVIIDEATTFEWSKVVGAAGYIKRNENGEWFVVDGKSREVRELEASSPMAKIPIEWGTW